MSKLETNTIDNISGSSTLNLGDTNATNITIDNGVTTLDFGTGISTVSNMPGAFKATPAFHAYLSSTTEVANGSAVKLAANTEIYDTDSDYDNSTNYRFTPTTAGKYFVYGMINGQTNAYKLYQVKAMIYKNGSEYATNANIINADTLQRIGIGIQTVVDMNGSSDYLELYGFVDIHVNGTEEFVGSGTQPSFFGAYKITGA